MLKKNIFRNIKIYLPFILLLVVISALAASTLILSQKDKSRDIRSRAATTETSENIILILKIIKDNATNKIILKSASAVKDGFLEDSITLHKSIGPKTYVLEQIVDNAVKDTFPVNFVDHIDSPPPKPGSSQTTGDPPVKLANPEAILTLRHINLATYRVRTISTGRLTSLSPMIIEATLKNVVPAQSFAKGTYSYSRTTKSFSRIVTPQITFNTANDSYFDVLFLSSAYTDFNLYISDTAAISQFLLEVSPYSDLANHIRITSGITTQDLGCVHYGRVLGCDTEKVRAAASAWNYDTIVVIHNTNIYGGGVGTRGIAASYRNVDEWARHVVLHEMGHSVALLADEFSYGLTSTYKPNIPNCDLSPCNKWAGTYQTGCFQTCAFTDWYRPTAEGCIMRRLTPEGGIKFDEVDRKVMYEYIVQDISGPVPTLSSIQPLQCTDLVMSVSQQLGQTSRGVHLECAGNKPFNHANFRYIDPANPYSPVTHTSYPTSSKPNEASWDLTVSNPGNYTFLCQVCPYPPSSNDYLTCTKWGEADLPPYVPTPIPGTPTIRPTRTPTPQPNRLVCVSLLSIPSPTPTPSVLPKYTCTVNSDCVCAFDTATNQCAFLNRSYPNQKACTWPDFCSGLTGDCYPACVRGRCFQYCPKLFPSATPIPSATGQPFAYKSPTPTRTPTPSSSCLTTSQSQTNPWKYFSFTPRSGIFTVEFDARPGGNSIDALVGLSSNNTANSYNNVAALIRFYTNGRIEARDYDLFKAQNPISYTGGTTYHFRLDVNYSTRLYSAYVRIGSGTEQAIGLNYRFRDTWTGGSSLSYLAVYATSGSETVCNLSIK